jgi:superfamily II DNA/RNA helicase
VVDSSSLAFGLAMVTRLAHRKATAKHPLGIVLVPTRELAMQVTDALMPYAQAVDLDIRLIAGGMPYAKQIDALKRGVPIVVAINKIDSPGADTAGIQG